MDYSRPETGSNPTTSGQNLSTTNPKDKRATMSILGNLRKYPANLFLVYSCRSCKSQNTLEYWKSLTVWWKENTRTFYNHTSLSCKSNRIGTWFIIFTTTNAPCFFPISLAGIKPKCMFYLPNFYIDSYLRSSSDPSAGHPHAAHSPGANLNHLAAAQVRVGSHFITCGPRYSQLSNSDLNLIFAVLNLLKF